MQTNNTNDHTPFYNLKRKRPGSKGSVEFFTRHLCTFCYNVGGGGRMDMPLLISLECAASKLPAARRVVFGCLSSRASGSNKGLKNNKWYRMLWGKSYAEKEIERFNPVKRKVLGQPSRSIRQSSPLRSSILSWIAASSSRVLLTFFHCTD